ncbi:hypothetical protein IG631_15813 [Alternaria alternata]|nr:hypothetical protein IG631_15813 [Alternaria alternata]
MGGQCPLGRARCNEDSEHDLRKRTYDLGSFSGSRRCQRKSRRDNKMTLGNATVAYLMCISDTTVLAWIEKRPGVPGSVHTIVAIYMIKVCTCSGGRQRSSPPSNAASPTRFEFPPTF